MMCSPLVFAVRLLSGKTKGIVFALSSLMLVGITAMPSRAVDDVDSLQSDGEPLQLAQAITASPDGTGTVVTQTGETFDITGGTRAGDNLFHSFEEFGLDAEQAANILSNPDTANILGRVMGGDPSVIDGLLQVVGGDSNLFLINPSGIIFGPNAQVIMPAAFTATTADAVQFEEGWFNAVGTNDYASLMGDPSGFAFVADEPGAVINGGRLVSPGESVTLLGGSVINTGTIETPGGTITIAAVPEDNLIRISQEGSLLSLELPVEAQAAIHTDPAALTGTDIPALLAGGEVSQDLGIVAEEGVVKLVSTDTIIPTDAGTAIVSGNLDAADVAVDGVGGGIDVLGDRIGLLDATLDASGNNGGGSVRVGGEFQGEGPIPNADRTFVGEGSSIAADALVDGDGGTVIVWADEATQFFGNITARGGNEAGDGGFAEVSGRASLSFDGTVDLTSPAGFQGQLLLDPDEVVITEDGRDEDDNVFSQAILDDGAFEGSDGDDLAVISASKIVELLNTSDILITANDRIGVYHPINAEPNNTAALTLRANRISLYTDIRLQDGDLTLDGAVTVKTPDNSFLSRVLSGRNLSIIGDVRAFENSNGELYIDFTRDILVLGEIGGGEFGFRAIHISNPFESTNAGNVEAENISASEFIKIRANGDITLTSPSDINFTSLENGDVPSLNIPSVQLVADGDIRLTSSGNIDLSNEDVAIRSDEEVTFSATSNTSEIILDQSQLEIEGLAQFSAENIRINSSRINATDSLSLQALNRLSVIDNLTEGETVLQSGNDMVLQGNIEANFDVLNHPESIFISNGNLSLISDTEIEGNGRFLAYEAINVLTSSMSPGDLVYNHNSSEGILSAEGNVSFGNYTGPSLKIEATGSIIGGDITITEANTNLSGSDPEIVTLAESSALILRAGVNSYEPAENNLSSISTAQNQSNLSTDNPNYSLQGNSFSFAGAADELASISVGSIDTSAADGTVTIEAPGDIRTEEILTGGVFEAETGSVSVTSSRGSILLTTGLRESEADTIPPPVIRTGKQPIHLNAKDDIILVGGLDTQSFGETSSSVTLLSGNDIQVDYILAGYGGIDVRAGDSFRATNSWVPGPFESPEFVEDDFINNPDLVDFLVRQGYDRESVLMGDVRLESPNFRVSLIARPNTINNLLIDKNAHVTIRYGDATEEILNSEFPILGRTPTPNTDIRPVIGQGQILILGDMTESFILGPQTIGFTPVDTSLNLNDFNPSDPFAFTINSPIPDDLPPDEIPEGISIPYDFPSDEFPEGTSGLVAGILVGRGNNIDMNGLLQSRVFEGMPEDPIDGPVDNGPIDNGPVDNGPVDNGPVDNGPIVEAPDGADAATREDMPIETQNLEAEESHDLCKYRREEVLSSDRILTIDASILNEVQPFTSATLLDPCDTRSPIEDTDNVSEVIDESDVELPE